jgi:hypothetical protein
LNLLKVAQLLVVPMTYVMKRDEMGETKQINANYIDIPVISNTKWNFVSYVGLY